MTILNIGERVNIFNATIEGKEIVEGQATLVKCLGEFSRVGKYYIERWQVCFDKERDTTYERNVRISRYRFKQTQKGL